MRGIREEQWTVNFYDETVKGAKMHQAELSNDMCTKMTEPTSLMPYVVEEIKMTTPNIIRTLYDFKASLFSRVEEWE